MYEQPDLTPKQRDDVWLELENQYRPYLSSQGITYFEKGTRWQYQAHIFENPFYYIDYCLAQTVAFEFLLMISKDRDSAWEKYLEFLKYSSLKFTDILKTIHMDTPFKTGMLKDIAKLGEMYY
jgi:oligoendopeptidase F